MCDRRNHNDQASGSASSRQCACPFYSSRAVFFFCKASHHPGLTAPLQPRLGSLRLLAFEKAKIAVEIEICECDGHTVHKLSQRRLTAEWLVPRKSDCSWMHSKVSPDWMPSYIMATQPVLDIFKMAWYFPVSLPIDWAVGTEFLYVIQMIFGHKLLCRISGGKRPALPGWGLASFTTKSLKDL